MNKRLTTILLSAFIVAVICSYLVYRVAGNQMNSGAKPNTTKVVLAARDLAIGTLIQDPDLTLGDWVGTLPKGAVVSKQGAVGRGVVSGMIQGEPILDSRLALPGSGGGLAATIRPGMRACAVRVNDVVGVAGFIGPGMRVDVLIAGTSPGGGNTGGTQVKTLLQNIEVLSAGTNIQKDNEGKPSQVPVVNLLVTPEQAEILSLASNETRIQLVLRNPVDTEVSKPPGVFMAGLFSDGRPVPKPRAAASRARVAKPLAAQTVPVSVEKPAPPPRIFLVEVLNGSKRTEEKFKDKER